MASILPRPFKSMLPVLLAVLVFANIATAAESWWNPKWTARKQITLDTTGKGAVIGDPIGTSTVLVRLFDGNFQFAGAKEDGSDLRFVASDDKTALPYHIERWDTLLNEGLVWVKVPDISPAGQTTFWLYYGNSADAVREDNAKGSYDSDTSLVYHFSENGGPPADSSASGLNADKGGASVPGALIAGGIRLSGQTPITIPAGPPIAWTTGGSFTFSAWIKPTALHSNGVLLSRREGPNGVVIGEDNGVPYLEVVTPAGTLKTPAGAPLVVNVWKHLAVTASGGNFAIYLDGVSYATLAAPLPALGGAIVLGKDGTSDAIGFSGEVDELQISKVARGAGWAKFAFINQGTSVDATKLLVAGADEISGKEAEHSELSKHLSLFADISKSLTFDGWVVIILCALLAVVGWMISLSKFFYLNKINKASRAFLKQWEQISTDITALDHADEENVKSMGGSTTGAQQRLVKQSPLFHLYHLGSQEIQHRITAAAPAAFQGLSGRSIAAIKATLDGGQVREVQKLNGKLVYLTIGIAGGPYLGLLGTVIGVMITFAVIAQSGEVEINSIAPGIAGALLATVAGLAVAIPALFAYSYLSSRIKDAVSGMQIFIDEFIARIAEAYPSASE